jgi:putative restriction endonuclease
VEKATRIPWSHHELVVACGLYFTLPFGQMHARNRIIVEVADLLGRTPSSLAMKLVNFASLDPEQRARGIRGLAGHSRADEQVWKEFGSNWDQMTVLSQTSLESLRMGRQAEAEVVLRQPHDDIATEAVRSVKTRTMQGFFRKVVLAAYGSRCCVTGNPVEGLLVASHILPWADFPAERLNPKNGLCLAAHFDRAFDCGLIAFDRNVRLVLSPALRSYTPNEAIESEFIRREGQPIGLPERFSPHADFLDYHRTKIFRAVQKG